MILLVDSGKSCFRGFVRWFVHLANDWTQWTKPTGSTWNSGPFHHRPNMSHCLAVSTHLPHEISPPWILLPSTWTPLLLAEVRQKTEGDPKHRLCARLLTAMWQMIKPLCPSRMYYIICTLQALVLRHMYGTLPKWDESNSTNSWGKNKKKTPPCQT